MRYDVMVPVIFTLLLVPCVLSNASGDTPDMDQGGWERPAISEVEVSLKNASGFYQLSFLAEGTAEPGTEDVGVTFGGSNGTGIEFSDDGWFAEETNFQLFNNRILLEYLGNSTDPWSTWRFEIYLALSSTGGLKEALSGLSGIPGLNFDPGNISLEEMDLNVTNLTRALAGMRFYFIARSYNDTGAWGQKAFDMTDQVQTALLGFLIEEGLIEDGLQDDDEEADDDMSEDEGKNVNTGLVIGISVLGALLLLGAVVLGSLLLIRRSGKE